MKFVVQWESAASPSKKAELDRIEQQAQAADLPHRARPKGMGGTTPAQKSKGSSLDIILFSTRWGG